MPMRSGGLLFLLLVVLTPVNAATSQQQPIAPKFKAQSELVLIPTVVRNKAGHIPNLKKEDFTVFDNGKPRQIDVFEEVRQASGRVEAPHLPPGVFTNTLEGSHERNNLVIIALDTITTPLLRQTVARKQLLAYLAKSVQGNTMVALVRLQSDGAHLIHDFTADPKVLAQALRDVSAAQPAVSERMETRSEQDRIFCFNAQCGNADPRQLALVLSRWQRGEFEHKVEDADLKLAILGVLGGLEQLAHAVAGLPGRKSLLWIGGGFPFSLSSGAAGVQYAGEPMAIGSSPQLRSITASETSDMIRRYDYVWKALNEAGVALYGIDVRPFTNPDIAGPEVGVRSPYAAARARQLSWETQSTFWTFANATGGQTYNQVADVGKAYAEAINDSSAYYVIGYYLDRKKDLPGWHDLSVKVRVQGADLRSRKGYLVSESEDKAARKTDVLTALVSPFDYTGLPVSGQWRGISGRGTNHTAAFRLSVPATAALLDETAGNLLDLDVEATANDAQGKPIARVSQTIQGKLPAETAAQIKQRGIVYDNKFELPPGAYAVKFVLRDNLTGRIGSVSTLLKIE